MTTNNTPRFDAHVKARRALARRVVNRRLDWSNGDYLLPRAVRKALTWEQLDAALMRAAFDAISQHTWREGWGNKLSRYHTFGPPQRVIGILADVPAHEIHSIMCNMTDHVRARAAEILKAAS